jgi:hypothetical protein
MAMKEVKRGKKDAKDKDAGESHRRSMFRLGGHVPKDDEDPSVAMKEVKRVKNKDAKNKVAGESHRRPFGLGRVPKKAEMDGLEDSGIDIFLKVTANL